MEFGELRPRTGSPLLQGQAAEHLLQVILEERRICGFY